MSTLNKEVVFFAVFRVVFVFSWVFGVASFSYARVYLGVFAHITVGFLFVFFPPHHGGVLVILSGLSIPPTPNHPPPGAPPPRHHHSLHHEPHHHSRVAGNSKPRRVAGRRRALRGAQTCWRAGLGFRG